jgi:hypothetical protein
MYHLDTLSTKKFSFFFWRHDFLPAFLVSASSLLPVRAVLLTIRPRDPGTLARGWVKQQVVGGG